MHTIKSRENNLHRKARKQLGLQTAQILGVVFWGNKGRVKRKNLNPGHFCKFSIILHMLESFLKTQLCAGCRNQVVLPYINIYIVVLCNYQPTVMVTDTYLSGSYMYLFALNFEFFPIDTVQRNQCQQNYFESRLD